MTKKWDYWNGPDDQDRRIKYASVFKPEYESNAAYYLSREAALRTAFAAETQIELPEGWSSGWRPPSVNEATSHAGKLSAHLTAEAGDKRDRADGAYAWWCMRHPELLEQHNLYMEHPVATVLRSYANAKARAEKKGTDPKDEVPTPWCHTTTRAPASHNRIYFPDKLSVPEWNAFLKAGGKPGMSYIEWLALQEKSK